MKLIKILFLICLILVFIFIYPLNASEINITANKMEVFESEGVVMFTGKVFGELKKTLKFGVIECMYIISLPKKERRK